MAPWYPGDTTLSLTEADALDSMLDSSALPGSAFTEVAREFGENAEGQKCKVIVPLKATLFGSMLEC